MDNPEQPAETTGEFDARRYLIKVQGNKEYLPVAARLLWFRTANPDWGIVTEATAINLYPDGNRRPYAIFRAQIFNAEGRLMATATKYEDDKGFPDFIEKAETGAVGRALAMCGYGTQFAPELSEGEDVCEGGREVAKRPNQTSSRNNQGNPASQNPPADIDERKKTLFEFGNLAAENGYDVLITTDGKQLLSYNKLGALLVRLASCNKPADFKDWFPPVNLTRKAIAALEREIQGRNNPAPEPEQPRGQTARRPLTTATAGSRTGNRQPVQPNPANDADSFDDGFEDPFAGE